jgi:hypothetical protein
MNRTPAGIVVGIGSVAVIAAAFLASAFPSPVMRYAILALTVFTITAVADRWGAPAMVALIGYLVFEGFIVNRFGVLTWDGPATAARITTLVAAVVFGRLAGDSYRLYRLYATARKSVAAPVLARAGSDPKAAPR